MNGSGVAVGIDLGTTNSVVAHCDPSGRIDVLTGSDGDRIVPSAVYFDPSGASGDGTIVVGRVALQYALLEPHRAARLFKRGMGERTFLESGEPFEVDGKAWSPEELSSLVLKKLRQNAEQSLQIAVDRAVITVPAYFGEPERAATKLAGELAGFDVLRILNEPTAAAIAHGLDNLGRTETVLVFDLGGGTFDVTVMDIEESGAMEVRATGGDRRLGGADFDAMILRLMQREVDSLTAVDLTADAQALMDARMKAEGLKKDLSARLEVKTVLTAGGRPVPFELRRDRCEELLTDRLADVRDTIINTIDDAGVRMDELDRVLLVGGSSRIPAFQRLIADITGQEPTFSSNLDEDVARGAAVMATKLSGNAAPRSPIDLLPVPVDVASHGLGVSILADDDATMVNDIVIPAGTRIPASATKTYSAASEGQTGIEVELNEGDDRDLDYVRRLGTSHGVFDRPVPRGHPIRLEMSYDSDQLIVVRAYDDESDVLLCELAVRHDTLLDPGAADQARRALEGRRID